ncbi:MAG TPA: MMPL family transporter, partial [Dehalococcoidia bacterium]|nr:MMPL family transporter [Dehalococcoidia bacterium]
TLLAGSQSQAGQTYTAFSKDFGSDPIVLVFTAQNPSAPYLEPNLERLGALEIDLAHDPRVASVLGPGTVAGSLRQAAVAEVNKVLTEYPYFVAETAYLEQVQKGTTNQQALSQAFQSAYTDAQQLLAVYVDRAATDAHNARAAYKDQPGDRIIDSRERAVDAAVAKDPIPPLFAEYLAGPTNTANPAAAQQFFTRVAAAYGDCDDTIAALLKVTPSCQVFFERTLLDLPNCPTVSSQQFCDPKPQWSAVLPRPATGSEAYEIVTIRLKAQYANDTSVIQALQNKITTYLAHGIGSDPYTQSLSPASRSNLTSLGPLNPTECGGAGQSNAAACYAAYHDAKLSYVIAGAPLLAMGVARSMTSLLAVLFPVALLVMLLLLVGIFRVRGRWLPLLAAVAATVATIGLTLAINIAVTPAVLAGVPVLLGLGVDYAVQLVARYQEQRVNGDSAEIALRTVLRNTGGATIAAALATLVGLGALLVVTGIDAGPLVAVPLVAEFALVLCIGVVLAWLGALFVAMPFAVWSDRRKPLAAAGAGTQIRPATRTLAIADNLRGIIALAVVTALAGWVLLGRVPVQTDVQQLLASSLPELSNIETVQAETGYTNEVDVYVHGNAVTGAIDTSSGAPQTVVWQCIAASAIRTVHASQVVNATSIGDYVIGAGATVSGSSSPSCVPSPTAGATPSPPPSASPSASPSSSATASPATASPTASRSRVRNGATAVEDAASATPAASSSPLPTPIGSASPAATPAPSASPKTSVSTQTPFLCDLRLFPLLSRTLVMPIGVDTQPCPAVDEYQQQFLSSDASPISPDASRIVIGVHANSVADEAQLVDGLRQDVAAPPSGITAQPAGLAVLATTAYDNIVSRGYVLNVVPIVLVGVALLAVYREPRRALLPLLPTVLAAGWAPLLLLLLGRLPWGATLGSYNPLTIVMGSLVVALATEFGVVLLSRFYEERRRGLEPDQAAAAALGGVGRAIRVSAVTLAAGFFVLALSGLFPDGLPLVADFGLVVVLDLGLAVLAVFGVMLPAAVALERRSPLSLPALATEPVAPVQATTEPAGSLEVAPVPRRRSVKKPAREAQTLDDAPPNPPSVEDAPAPSPLPSGRRGPRVSGRRRQQAEPADAPVDDVDEPRGHRPGVSGRPRRRG